MQGNLFKRESEKPSSSPAACNATVLLIGWVSLSEDEGQGLVTPSLYPLAQGSSDSPPQSSRWCPGDYGPLNDRVISTRRYIKRRIRAAA